MPPSFRRGASSREHLEIQWTFPVHLGEAKPRGDESRSEQARQALTREAAFALIAGDDPRPLLVLRECLTCTGTDDALLTRQADNEKTMLMSRWFHCVKLPADVIEPEHPFHSLFSEEDPAHLFAATREGNGRLELTGAQSRTELWKAMGATLDSQYKSKYEPQLKKLAALLSRFDELDQKLALANAKLEEAIERHGPNSSKMNKAQKALSKLRVSKAKLDAEMQEHSKLSFKQPAREPEQRSS